MQIIRRKKHYFSIYKIENARSVVIAVREQRRQHQEAVEGKLLANEMGLTELRKMIDTWKGEEILLQQLEAVVLVKEKECKKTRKLVAEASDQWGSRSWNRDFGQLNATPSALQRQSSSKSNNASTRRHLMLQTQSSQRSLRLLPTIRSGPRSFIVTSASSRALSSKASRPAYQTSNSDGFYGIMPRRRRTFGSGS
jgi:hypothetical protein